MTIRSLGARIRDGWSAPPEVADTLPQPMLYGDADRGLAMVAGTWKALGHAVPLEGRTVWASPLPDPRLEAERQSCLWLDDLAALGNRPARGLAQAWVQDWIRRFGTGSGPGWQPEIAGRRAKRWATHAATLTDGLDRVAADRFWRTLAGQQRYLTNAWPTAAPGLPRLRALSGLVWSGLVLPHAGHAAAVSDMGRVAGELIDAEGGTPSRSPEELAETLILLNWTARALENAGRHASPEHLTAIARGVPVLRSLRMGDGAMARFNGGGSGVPERIDQALAELKLGVQMKPKLAMGYARLAGGRVVLVMDGADPPGGDAATSAHAGTLAFEMSVGRQPVVVNAGPGRAFGGDWAVLARQTAAHSTVEIDGRSSARLETRGIAVRAFGARLVGGPSFVSVRQAQDATGQWLLATQDGYVASHGLLHERRIFVDAKGMEARGEEILTVADARARAQFDRSGTDGAVPFAVRFHLHPDVEAEFDAARQLVTLALPTGELWVFRAAGGVVQLEESIRFDTEAPRPLPARQVVVHAEAVEYLGHVTWSFARVGETPAAP
jgi:uncharacterized heparinase superfamily protein